MMLKRIWASFVARNYEFFRDRAAFGWNFIFPFLLIVGFGLIFGESDQKQFKVGIWETTAQMTLPRENEEDGSHQETGDTIPPAFRQGKQVRFLVFPSQQEAEEKLRRHKIDLLLDRNSKLHRYWINDSSPQGLIAEQLFLASFLEGKSVADKQIISGKQIRYIDWLFPGILGMNMSFSALWGVGFVIVRYRKNGALKRLKATPLTPFEYLSAQMLSRIFLLLFTTIIVWIGSDLIFHFQVHGSYLSLLLIFFLGGLSLCSMGLVLAARGISEEFTSGILNFISWPMSFLSEVWFSLEGAPVWLQKLALVFPLTHLLTGARKIINDGGSFADIHTECLALLLITAICLTIAARLFSWTE